MATSAITVEARGLKELRAALKGLDDSSFTKELRLANKGASELVATGARESALGASNPRMGHEAAETIKARATQTSASVTGGRGVAWFMGHNFGSNRYKQFPPKTTPDYHLYSTIKAEGENIVEQYSQALDTLIERAGFK